MTGERVNVEYAVTISVDEDDPAPTCEDIALAIYRECETVDSQDAVHVTSEGGAL